MLLHLEILRPDLDGGPKAEVPFAERRERRQLGDGVGRQVVWLQAKSVEEGSEEEARGKSEPSLEMSDENHPFPGCRGWLVLAGGTSALDARRDSPSSPQPIDLGRGYLGPLPSSALGLVDLVV